VIIYYGGFLLWVFRPIGKLVIRMILGVKVNLFGGLRYFIGKKA